MSEAIPKDITDKAQLLKFVDHKTNDTTTDSAEQNPLRASPPQVGVNETGFAPLNAPDFCAGIEGADTDWILYQFFPKAGLILFVGKPKMGKTTVVYHGAAAIVMGGEFLGRPTQKGGVLIIALEEHPHQIKMRLEELGVDQCAGLFIFAGAVTPDATWYRDVKAFIEAHDICLVVIDALSTFWAVRDENSASEVTSQVKPLLKLARDSGACVLMIHHSRKSEGLHGDEIRGSGALFAMVDTAFMLRGHEVDNRRKLVARSRYQETPSELILELQEGTYVSLGDPSEVNYLAKRQKMKEALSETPEPPEVLYERSGLKPRAGHRHLQWLVEHDEAQKVGLGKKGSPFLYSLPNALHAGGTGVT